MSDEWSAFSASNGPAGPTHVLVNVSFESRLNQSHRPVLLKVTVPSQMASIDGAPNPNEVPVLDEIEDRLVGSVEMNLAAVYVVRMAHIAGREFYFHSDSADGLEDLIYPIAEAFEYPLRAENFPDPQFGFYCGAMQAVRQHS